MANATEGSVEISTVEISHRTYVAVPRSEAGVVISHAAWARIMKRIEDCAESVDWHWAIGWTAIGVVISSFASAVTLYASVDFTKMEGANRVPNWHGVIGMAFCVGLTVAAAAVAWASLYYAILSMRHTKKLRHHLLEDMGTIAHQYSNP